MRETAPGGLRELLYRHMGVRPALWALLLSILIYAIIGYLLQVPRGEPPAPWLRQPLSIATAVSNAATLALMTAGWLAIRAGHRRRHQLLMELALVSITAFLVLYVTRQFLVGTLPFEGPETVYRLVYLPLLIPHLVISAACVPPVIYNAIVGVTRSLDEVGLTAHPRVGRIVVPLWMLSSIQGLTIFAMLQIYSAV